MDKSTVVLIPCTTYQIDEVYKGLKWGIDQLGGIKQFVQPEEKILLKPNFLRKSEPDQAIITHPAIFQAFADILIENEYSHISYGDSPGVGTPDKTAQAAGFEAIAKDRGIKAAEFTKGETVAYKDGKVANEFVISQGVIEADAIINLCKMKTHALERITGAVKNMYGCVQGLHKGMGHTKYKDADSFAKMLIDLNQLIKPRLHIMDGVMAMEGNGPASGDPVQMGVILISADSVALDTVFANLIHLNPKLVPTIRYGAQEGLGVMNSDEILIVTPDGEKKMEEMVELYGNKNFVVRRNRLGKGILQRMDSWGRRTAPKPYIIEEKCIRCGICVEACPLEEKAIAFSDGKDNPPKYKEDICIQCFCCQEMCPKKAIAVRSGTSKRSGIFKKRR